MRIIDCTSHVCSSDLNEQPRLISDDFGEAAPRLVPGQTRRAESHDLQALAAVDQRAPQRQRLRSGDRKRLARPQHRRREFIRCPVDTQLEAELCAKLPTSTPRHHPPPPPPATL